MHNDAKIIIHKHFRKYREKFSFFTDRIVSTE